MLFVQKQHHVLAAEFERLAGRDRSCRSIMNANATSKRLFSDKIAGGEQRDSRLFTSFRDDCELRSTRVEKEYRIREATLREKNVSCLHLDHSVRHTSCFQKTCRIEERSFSSGHRDTSSDTMFDARL